MIPRDTIAKYTSAEQLLIPGKRMGSAIRAESPHFPELRLAALAHWQPRSCELPKPRRASAEKKEKKGGRGSIQESRGVPFTKVAAQGFEPRTRGL
jgi:hypothetical protein